MAFMLTGGIAVLLAVLAILGYMRDLRRAMLALLGTLGGAILVNFWGAQWGANLAGRLVAGNVQRTTLWVNCLIFLWSALMVGYGGGALLPRAAKERPFGQRLAGTLLGLINGILIVGFLLRYATAQQANFAATVKADLLANGIHAGLPWLFLGSAVVVSALSIVRGLLSLLSRRPVPAPAAPARAPAPASPKPSVQIAPGNPSPPERRVGPQEVLGKINDVTKQ